MFGKRESRIGDAVSTQRRSRRTLLNLGVALLLVTFGAVVTPGFAQGRGNGPGKPPGGEDEGYGNNLSVPAVFAEGYGLLGLPLSVDHGLRPRPGEAPNGWPFWDSNTSVTLADGTIVYPQQTPSVWQAEIVDGSTSSQNVVVNWADNLTKQFWTATSKVRVEAVLYQDPGLADPATTDTLTAYTMRYISGTGTTELYGADMTTYASSYRRVFSVAPRLIIQKIDGPAGNPVGPAYLSSAVYEKFGQDGPGGFGAEVNVAGAVTYGYNWDLKNVPGILADRLGWWRLTLQVDPVANYEIAEEEGGAAIPYSVNSNILFSAVDPGDTVEEVLFKPTIVSPSRSVLEIEIRAARGGRK